MYAKDYETCVKNCKERIKRVREYAYPGSDEYPSEESISAFWRFMETLQPLLEPHIFSDGSGGLSIEFVSSSYPPINFLISKEGHYTEFFMPYSSGKDDFDLLENKEEV